MAGVLLCGQHKSKALAGHAAAVMNEHPAALFTSDWYDATDVLRWAAGK